jgi:hypothetical protein
MSRLPALALLLACVACAAEVPPLTSENESAVRAELERRHLTAPKRLFVDHGFVIAEYELTKAEIVAAQPLRTFGQDRLIAIREALLPSGYKDYRVNVNGEPPGTGLTQRFGSARFIDPGEVEWITGTDR